MVLSLHLTSLNWQILQLERVREKTELERRWIWTGCPESLEVPVTGEVKLWLSKALGNQMQPWCQLYYDQEVGGHGNLQRWPQIFCYFEYWQTVAPTAASVVSCDHPTNSGALLCVPVAGSHPVFLQRSITDPSTQLKSMKLCRNPVPEQKTTLNHCFCLPLEANLSCSNEFAHDGNLDWAGMIWGPAKHLFQSLSAELKRPKNFQNR